MPQRFPRMARSETMPRVRELAATMATAAVVGAGTGIGLVAVDRMLLSPPPVELAAVAGVRIMLGGLVGGLITVAVFSLWMRTVVVGLVSDQFSPRVLTAFLEDRFQRLLLAAMAAGIVGIIAVLLALPGDDEAPAPLLGTLASVAIALAALAGVLAAIQQATRSLSLPRLVRRLADQALDVLMSQPAPRVETAAPPEGPGRRVRTLSMGWVTGIDTAAALEALPDGGRVRLVVKIGDFLTPRSVVAVVSTPGDGGGDREEAEPDLEAIAEAVDVAPTRSPDLDLGLALGQLVDVAVHALDSSDTATAHEALVHLGAVLEAIVERGLTPWHDADDRDRTVFDVAGWDATDHLRVCAQRLRGTAAREPVTARHLLQVLGDVRIVAEEVRNQPVLDEIDRQVDTLLSLSDVAGAVPDDRERLRRAADRARGSPGAG